MRLRIDLKIFIFLFIFYLTKQMELYGFIMFFAFLHELGHLFAGILFKLRPEKIEDKYIETYFPAGKKGNKVD